VYTETAPVAWLNEYSSPDYYRIGDALLDMQPPGSLADYDALRSMPLPDRHLRRLLDQPIDDFVLASRHDTRDTLLATANAILDWNGNAPYFRTRHMFAMGYEGMEAIKGVSLPRAHRLGALVTGACRLTVPTHPSPELSAYVCHDLYDVPAYAVTKRGRAVAFPQRSLAVESRDGLRNGDLFEGLKSMSQGRTEAEIKEFESRFWLAKALFQVADQESDYYAEIGGKASE